MFGTEAVANVVYDTLAATPAVANVVQGRIHNLMVVPPNSGLPAALHYAEQTAYGGLPVDATSPIYEEGLSYRVVIICEGKSTDPIRAAAYAALDALRAIKNTTSDGFTVNFERVDGEVPLTSMNDGDRFFRQLGNVYTVQVTAPE